MWGTQASVRNLFFFAGMGWVYWVLLIPLPFISLFLAFWLFGFLAFVFLAWRSLYDYAFYDAMAVLFFSLIRAAYTAGMV